MSLNAWSAILFCFAGLAGSAIGQQNLDSLRHVSNSSTLTFMERGGTCIDGPISKLSATAITVQPNGKSPIKRTNLLQISQGDALLFTGSDGKRLIPFDTFNMFYRGELEETRLAPLRRVQAEVC